MGHRPGARRCGQGWVAEDGQRATEDTGGSWWHSELRLPFGPAPKPVLKPRGRAGGSVSASAATAQASGASPWGLLTLLNQYSDGAHRLGKFRAWPRMSRLRVKEYLQLPSVMGCEPAASTMLPRTSVEGWQGAVSAPA